MKRSTNHLVIAALLGVLSVPVSAQADSGQLRDPTRCGTGPANCRKLPPMAGSTERNEPRLPSSETHRKPGQRLMQTSPLPSESLRRSPETPGSTGLDKGSTGITPYPRKKVPSH